MSLPELSIEDVDIEFENKPVKLIAVKSIPRLEAAGQTIGPIESGQEFEVTYWIAEELVEGGLARFAEETDLATLQDIYWREVIQPSKRLSPLPGDFYPALRRYLMRLKRSSSPDYEKALRLAQNIVNSRLGKIVSLASGPRLTEQALGSLTREERILYETLHAEIENYRSTILKLGR